VDRLSDASAEHGDLDGIEKAGGRPLRQPGARSSARWNALIRA
jgi:hypothetical protein